MHILSASILSMRIALCFHGQPRGLNTTARSYLSQSHEGVHVDTYIHSWWDGTGRYEGVGLYGHTYTVQTPPDFWEQVERIYAPIHVEKEPPRDLPLTPNFQKFALAQPAHIMPMTYSIQRALQLPKDAARDPYDWYVKVRMDLVIKSPPVAWHLLDPSVVYLANIHASGHPDGSLYLIPGRYIDVFRDIYGQIASCGSQGTEEHVLYHFLQNHRIPVQSLHLDYITDRAQFRVAG